MIITLTMEHPHINTSNESEQSAEDIATEHRIKSDASLIAEGAKIKAGRLEATEKQLESLRAEMNRDLESRTPEGQAQKKATETISRLKGLLGSLYGDYARIGTESPAAQKKEVLELFADCGIPITQEETLDAQGASFFASLEKEDPSQYAAEKGENAKTPLRDFIVAHYLEKLGS